MSDESLREKLKRWEKLYMEQEQREANAGCSKRELDEAAAKREAELNLQEAKRKAKQEGELQVKETIARRLLSKGLNIELVADATGLNRGKVVDIQRNMQK